MRNDGKMERSGYFEFLWCFLLFISFILFALFVNKTLPILVEVMVVIEQSAYF